MDTLVGIGVLSSFIYSIYSMFLIIRGETHVVHNLYFESAAMVIYFVKPNDTLWKIAKRFGSTVDDIARVNDIADADNIQIGQQLFIPRYHE